MGSTGTRFLICLHCAPATARLSHYCCLVSVAIIEAGGGGEAFRDVQEVNPTSSQTAADGVLLLFAPADGGSGDFSRLLFREDDAGVLRWLIGTYSMGRDSTFLPAMCTVFA